MDIDKMSREEFDREYFKRAYGIETPVEAVSNSSNIERILQKFEDISDLVSSRIGTIDKLTDRLKD